MSLKVLLADDSAAIKKVIQLSLQDVGVELKSIGTGKDALELAKQFKPDIAFIDVMLPQKSGYEVAAEMRKDALLKNTAIVLLWSAFMAFDETKFKSSGASAKLEKPFDANSLRNLVLKLVPKSAANPLAQHIELPNIDFEIPIGTVPPKPQTKTESNWSSSDFQDLNSFVSNQTPPLPQTNPGSWNNDNEWVKKDLGKFNVPVPEEENKEAVPFEFSENKVVDTSFLFKPPVPTSESTVIGPASTLSLEELSDIKLEAREIIEKIAWKLVPEIASQIIKEELDRLLSEEK